MDSSLSVFLSSLSIYLSIYISTYLSSIYLSINLSINLSIYLPVELVPGDEPAAEAEPGPAGGEGLGEDHRLQPRLLLLTLDLILGDIVKHDSPNNT